MAACIRTLVSELIFPCGPPYRLPIYYTGSSAYRTLVLSLCTAVSSGQISDQTNFSATEVPLQVMSYPNMRFIRNASGTHEHVCILCCCGEISGLPVLIAFPLWGEMRQQQRRPVFSWTQNTQECQCKGYVVRPYCERERRRASAPGQCHDMQEQTQHVFTGNTACCYQTCSSKVFFFLFTQKAYTTPVCTGKMRAGSEQAASICSRLCLQENSK